MQKFQKWKVVIIFIMLFVFIFIIAFEEVDLTTYTPACLAKTSDTNTFDGKKAWVYGETVLLLSQK